MYSGEARGETRHLERIWYGQVRLPRGALARFDVLESSARDELARLEGDRRASICDAINPLERGHICFRTDDIEGLKRRLEEQGIPYADYGKWAMAGWYQIFFHDPDGNIIEVHQTDL